MDELYVLARRVLLDALEALGKHREAIVLVGAQAVYLHVGDAGLAIAPFTSDGDLVLNPAVLAEVPPLETALRGAGFLPKRSDSVGVWVTHHPTGQAEKTEVCIDLLVPAKVSPGKGRRAARLTGHDARVARKVVGLEGALVDLDRMQLGSLAKIDPRMFEVQVAGPAALLVAKLIKINDRSGTHRHSDKDALDIARLLRGVETGELSERMKKVKAGSSQCGGCGTSHRPAAKDLCASRWGGHCHGDQGDWWARRRRRARCLMLLSGWRSPGRPAKMK